jgi:predicted nucleotidyltransferase
MVAAEGLSFDELFRSASDVVVFGSRATRVHRQDSDLDLLIISERSGHKRKGKLDLVFVPQAKIDSPIWRRTELARHIDAYGLSLIHRDFRLYAIVDEYAAMRKQARLHTLVKSLLLCWHALNDELRQKYFTRLYREVQRYRYLKEGSPVHPTAYLDLIMKSPDSISHVLKNVGVAANLCKDDAVRMRRLIASEARRIGPSAKPSNQGDPNRVAQSRKTQGRG